MPRTVEVPAVYRRILRSPPTLGAIEHAALECRTHEVLLAAALSRHGHVLVVTPEVERIRLLMRRWVPRARSHRGRRLLHYESGPTKLWVVADPTDIGNLPVPRVTGLFGVDCHRLERNPVVESGLKLQGPILLAGEMAHAGHWFYSWCRSTGVAMLRLPWELVCESFPDQLDLVLPRKDPSFPRRMALEDVPVQVRSTPLLRFCRSRLWIKSDKPAEFLDPRQIAHAEAELGADWESGSSGTPVVPFYPTPLQRRYLAIRRAAYRQGFRKFILLKYREGGFTSISQALMYRGLVENPNFDASTVAHTKEAVTDITGMMHQLHRRDPRAIRRIDDGSGSRMELENGSRFTIGTAGGRGFSRGSRRRRIHCTEASRYCEGPHQLTKCRDFMAGVHGAASHGIVDVESTPKGIEWFALTYRDAKARTNDYFPIFLAWFMDDGNRAKPGSFSPEEIRETVSEEERDLVDRHGLDDAQIAFRRSMQKKYGRLFAQEMPEDDESCFLTSGVGYFDSNVVRKLQRTVPEDYERIQVPGGYEVRWKPPRPNATYVAGVDTSEGIPGCDPSGIGILDRDTGEQVAALHGHFRPEVLAAHAVRMCTDYNRALLGIERENHGHVVLLEVIRAGYGTEHWRGGPLYYYEKPGLDPAKQHARAGWSTNSRTRDIMLGDLAKAVHEEEITIRDREFVAELGTFNLQSSGRFEADSGSHDDTIFKWGIAWQMRKLPTYAPGLTILEGRL